MDTFHFFDILYPKKAVEVNSTTTKNGVNDVIKIDNNIIYNQSHTNENYIYLFLIEEYSQKLRNLLDKPNASFVLENHLSNCISDNLIDLIMYEASGVTNSEHVYSLKTSSCNIYYNKLQCMSKYYEHLLSKARCKKLGDLRTQISKYKTDIFEIGNHSKYYIYDEEKIYFEYLFDKNMDEIDNEINAMEKFLNPEKNYYVLPVIINSFENEIIKKLILDLNVPGIIAGAHLYTIINNQLACSVYKPNK